MTLALRLTRDASQLLVRLAALPIDDEPPAAYPSLHAYSRAVVARPLLCLTVDSGCRLGRPRQ